VAHNKCRRLTKRAPDKWESARFTSIFLASSFSCSQALSTPAHLRVTQTVGPLVVMWVRAILSMVETISDIVLIGPVRTGKSTVGKLLADSLELPQISFDNVRWAYYQEIGYDENLARDIRARGGFLALVLYWNLFAAYAVERLLSDYRNCVIDFGAGTYETQESFNRVQQALSRYRNIVLLLPSPNKEASLRILRERDTNPPLDLNFDFNAHFLNHHSYYDLAKFTVYTSGKTPAETCEEILRLAGFD